MFIGQRVKGAKSASSRLGGLIMISLNASSQSESFHGWFSPVVILRFRPVIFTKPGGFFSILLQGWLPGFSSTANLISLQADVQDFS
jgi:hypothetical protein